LATSRLAAATCLVLAHNIPQITTYFFGLGEQQSTEPVRNQMFFRRAAIAANGCPTVLLSCGTVCGWYLLLTPLLFGV